VSVVNVKVPFRLNSLLHSARRLYAKHRFKLTKLTKWKDVKFMITGYPQPFRFTKENARENAAKSWAARRQRKAKLEAEAAKGRQSTPQSERLALEIERIVQMIEKCKDPDGLQKLSAAHSRLFRAWQVLTETPNPGSRRVKGRPSRPPWPTCVPLDPAPQEPVPPTAT